MTPTTPPLFPNFSIAIKQVQLYLRHWGNNVETESWQAMKKPIEFFEALNVSFSVYIPHRDEWVKQIKPNIPWADDHFLERVGGEPLNPGEQYKNWPMYKNNPNNDTSRVFNGKFSHSYMERFWPKKAGDGHFVLRMQNGSQIKSDSPGFGVWEGYNEKPIKGIRFDFSDLNTLIGNMDIEPFTRQAYLPIWFPEDGEAVRQGHRVPCTLGYHFIRRGKELHMVYYIRSCDFIRHFRDDIYMAVKLADHILQTLIDKNLQLWGDAKLGTFTMHITSLHIFAKEVNLLKD